MNSSSVCIDASTALAWIFGDQYWQQSDELMKVWARDNVRLMAPAMFYPEVTSAIRKNVFFKRILPSEGEQLLNIVLELPIDIMNGNDITRKAWQLAKEFNLPVCYDIQYLALAELADCEFWTLDTRLVNAVRGAERVRWVGSYSDK